MANWTKIFALLVLANCDALAAGLTGIWMGQAPGRKNGKEDLAFQFKNVNSVLSGVMFGDEFDLPVENLRVEGDRVTFSVTSINYYSGNRQTTIYTGAVSGNQLQLTREPVNTSSTPPSPDRPGQTFTLTRIGS